MNKPRYLFPRVGRPPRQGQPEDPRYAFIRYEVFRSGILLPGWWDGDTLLAMMLRSSDGPDSADRLWVPYLREWVRRTRKRTVVRQFDKWLDQAYDYMSARPELRVLRKHPGDMTEYERKATNQRQGEATFALLDYLKFPKPPYDLASWLDPPA